MAEKTVETGDFAIELPKDLKEVDAWKGGGGVKLPPGTYDFEIVKLMKTRSEDNVADVLKITYKVIGGEYDGQQTFPDQLSLVEQAEGKFKSWFEALIGGKLDPKKSYKRFKSSAFVGRKLNARVYMERYNNEDRNRFIDYQPFGSTPADRAAQGAGSTAEPPKGESDDKVVDTF